MQPQPFAGPRAYPILHDVETSDAAGTLVLGLAVTREIVRMDLRVPSFHPLRSETWIDVNPVAPVVEPHAGHAPILSHRPQSVPPITARSRASGRAQRLGVPVSLDHKGGQRACELDQVDLVLRWRARHAVIHRQGAQQAVRVVEDWHRPAGAQTKFNSGGRVSAPKLGALDVLNDHHRTGRRGGAATATPEGYGHRIDRLHVRGRQARGSTWPQQATGRIDQQYAAVQAVGPGFTVPRKPVEQCIQRRARTEQCQQSDLRAGRSGLRGGLWRTTYDRIDRGGPVLVRGCARHAAPVRRGANAL